jgi:hypothetical protein
MDVEKLSDISWIALVYVQLKCCGRVQHAVYYGLAGGCKAASLLCLLCNLCMLQSSVLDTSNQHIRACNDSGSRNPAWLAAAIQYTLQQHSLLDRSQVCRDS